MTRFKDLDPILHSQLRLAVISLLIGTEAAEFTYIREQTGSTAGNLSIQITKLKEAGYIEVEKNSGIITLRRYVLSLHMEGRSFQITCWL
jgi:DNA-binding MarR family transcriptional regulator